MKLFDRADFDEWQEITDKCDYATFFHTPTWSKVFAETYPQMEIAAKKFILDDGARAILPLIKVKAVKGLFKSYVSNIADVYGGIICERKIEGKEINEIFVSLIKRNVASISVTGNPLFDYDLPRQFKMKEDFTQVIRLGRDEARIWTSYKPACRRQINKARQEKMMCKEASNFDEWREYYSIYQDALKRWGNEATSNYPFSLFDTLYKVNNPNIKLWLIISDGAIVGGNLNFYHNKHCVYWHGALLGDYFRYGISNFLIHNIILDANARGYRYYDFNPSGGHEGTARFKDSFGPGKILIKRWTWNNPSVRAIANVKRKIMTGSQVSRLS